MKVEEKIEEVFPSNIKYLNEEGWSIVQVLGTNYEKVLKVKLNVPYAVGEQLFREENALICLVRRAN